jgi:hypothetical protein
MQGEPEKEDSTPTGVFAVLARPPLSLKYVQHQLRTFAINYTYCRGGLRTMVNCIIVSPNFNRKNFFTFSLGGGGLTVINFHGTPTKRPSNKTSQDIRYFKTFQLQNVPASKCPNPKTSQPQNIPNTKCPQT